MLSPKEHARLQKYINGLEVTRLSEAFDALSEPKRCLIFRALLSQKDLSVGEVADVVNISLPLASQHLKILLMAKLVSKSKSGRTVYYQINYDDPLVLALERAVDE